MIQFLPANHSNTNHIITILIHSDKMIYSDKMLFQNVFVTLLRKWRPRCFHGINAMILMPQIFDVAANENARYKRNEFKCRFLSRLPQLSLLLTPFVSWMCISHCYIAEISLNLGVKRHSTNQNQARYTMVTSFLLWQIFRTEYRHIRKWSFTVILLSKIF